MASHGSSFQKVFIGGAGSSGDAALDIPQVFSTQIYDGTNDNNHSIVNDIDLSGEGGMVWVKSREVDRSHALYDTERGVNKYVSSDATSTETDLSSASDQGIKAFNSDGFTMDDDALVNANEEYVSWTFRKQPKFFDVVTYTGNGTAGRTVAHNLGAVPGMIILKNLSSGSEGWRVYHRGANGGTNPEQYYAMLQASNAFAAASTPWNNTAPTSTEFTLGTDTGSNGNGNSFVAYLFAHNDSGDGEFGPNSDQDIIKCGTYTGNNSANGPTIDLGFEPQWVLLKNQTNQYIDWFIFDSMRAMAAVGINNNKYLSPNRSSAEDGTQDYITPRPDGFQVHGTGGHTNANTTYIYTAIRRGPLAVPTDASKVFHIETRGATAPNPPAFNASFDPDFVFRGVPSAIYSSSRLTQGTYMSLGHTNAASTSSVYSFDYHRGFHNNSSTSTSDYYYGWGRAPSFFDVVTWVGTGSNATIAHNLGVAPEMIWIKRRDGTASWTVLTNFTSSAYYDLLLNTTVEKTTRNNSANQYLTGTPTATGIPFGSGYGVNVNTEKYVGYLFATAAGVSKIGTFTGNGGSQNIDCGFSNGAKFILVKPLSTGSFTFWDTARGIASGDETSFQINDQSGLTGDAVDALSSGFTVNNTGNITNVNGTEYLFYAIAT